jgi:hypothetical protein
MKLIRKVLAMEEPMWAAVDEQRIRLGLLSTTAFIRMAVKEKLDNMRRGNKAPNTKRRS